MARLGASRAVDFAQQGVGSAVSEWGSRALRGGFMAGGVGLTLHREALGPPGPLRKSHTLSGIMRKLTLRRKVMEWNKAVGVGTITAPSIWLGLALGITVLAASNSGADDLDAVQPISNGGQKSAVESSNGDAPPVLEESATRAAADSAAMRPVVRFENANPRVNYGGLIERRMGAQGAYREKIGHQGVYSSQHARPDRSGRIRYSGASRGRLARYDAGRHGRIRSDGVTRARDRLRVAAIRENWMGADRRVVRFGIDGGGW
jgi:hypothetical protein